MRKMGPVEASRRAKLLPQVRLAYDALRAELAALHGIELLLVSTRREQLEQDAKVAAGLSATRDSWHLLGRALDVQTGRPNAAGEIVWDAKGKDVESYRTLHRVAPRYGFRGTPNGSAFGPDGSPAYIKTSSGKVWDAGHLEFREGYASVAAARAADTGKIA